MSYSTYCQSFFHPLFLSPCLLTGCSGNSNTLYNIIYFQLPHIFVISTSGSTYQLHTFSIITSHFIVIQPLRNGRPLNSYITKFTLHRHKPFQNSRHYNHILPCSFLLKFGHKKSTEQISLSCPLNFIKSRKPAQNKAFLD